MGQQQHSLPSVSRSGDPSWAAVVATTVRLWLQRHHKSPRPPTSRRQRGVLVLSAIAAMALGALVTLVFTQPDHKATSTAEQSEAAPPSTPNQLQIAAATRSQAAAWIKDQVLPGTDITCDSVMCDALTAAGVPAASLKVVQPATQDPLGSTIVVATPGVRNQFGSRLNSVYAPLLLASFGSGAERIDVWYVAPGGSADFEAKLASDRSGRIAEGEQLLANKNIQATQAARDELLAGNVDPRLLITLSALAGEMPVRLVAFDDSSPGASVPLRGAEIGASASAGLSAMLSFLSVQRSQYKPSRYGEVTIAGGQTVVTVQYDAPGWMGPNGPLPPEDGVLGRGHMKFPRLTRRLLMMSAASALLLSMPTAATAFASPATTGTGWIRLAHLSPNTPAVDVYLYAFDNSNAKIVLHHVAYGTVSPYEPVTAGDYSVAMRAAGASATSQPVLSTSVTIKADHAYTVAGMGPESGLRLQVMDDDLTTPIGKSLVRVIQASLKQQTVSVSFGSTVLASALGFASVSPYQAVFPGTKTVNVSAGGADANSSVTLAAGTVHTLVVLDGASGLEVVNLEDASGSGKPPLGGVSTGFGGTAPHGPGSPVPWLVAIAAGSLLALTGGLSLRRRQLRAGI